MPCLTCSASSASANATRLLAAIITLTFLFCLPAHAGRQNNDNETLLRQLDEQMEKAPVLNAEKERSISGIRTRLRKAKNPADLYDLYRKLYREYLYFQFDSACAYASRMENTAARLNSPQKSAEAKLALFECYNSVGFFKDCSDLAHELNTSDLTPEQRLEFNSLMVKYYRNMSSFVGANIPLGQSYVDSLTRYNDLVLAGSPHGSYAHAMAGLTRQDTRGIPSEKLAESYASLPSRFKLDPHELAVVHSNAGRAYLQAGNTDLAIRHLAISAINDIKSYTRETTASKDLATILHSTGDLERANVYIHHALEDAVAYNSRIRQLEINSVLPIIESKRYGVVSTRVSILAVIVVLLVALLALSIFLFFKLRRRNRTLAAATDEIRHKSEELEQSNDALVELNQRIKETAEIKDQYIMQSLIGNADFINRVEDRIRRAISRLRNGKYEETSRILLETETKDERARMYSSFDNAFLTLFPNFPDEFNALLPEDARIDFGEDTGLPSDVRIFALMRLGIENVAEVASYLNLSVNTIYVYKTRVKARAIVPKNEFEERIMQIPKP